jgi:DNA-binding transcriptional ArsR family regulator
MNLRRDVFQAFTDPTRRTILLLVASQSMTAGAIAFNFDTARPTVSKHLQILTECELLRQEQNGREIHYHLNPQKMKEIADFVEPFRAMWEERFSKLENIMKKHKAQKTIAWNSKQNCMPKPVNRKL